MAERGSWAVQQVSGVGVQTVEDARHSMAALWVPAGAVTSRSGMVPTGTAAVPGSVLATTPTANTLVHVQPFRYVRQSSRGGGTYTMVLDAIKDLDVLNPGSGGTAADPSNARIDLIIAQQSDTYFGDANSNMVVKRVTGTPSGSPVDPTVTGSADYVLLARITVPANATTIQTANIANVSQPAAVAVGGLLPVASQSERDAIANPYIGMQVYRKDKGWSETYNSGAWRVDGSPLVATLADVTNPYTSQIVRYTGDGRLYEWTGSAWTPLARHARYVRTAAYTGGNWTGDKQVSFPTARTSDSAVTPSGGSGDTANTSFSLAAGLWRITAGTRVTAGAPQISIATGVSWSIANIIAIGSGGSANDNASVELLFSTTTVISVNIFNSAAANVETTFGDATFVSFTRSP